MLRTMCHVISIHIFTRRRDFIAGELYIHRLLDEIQTASLFKTSPKSISPYAQGDEKLRAGVRLRSARGGGAINQLG